MKTNQYRPPKINDIVDENTGEIDGEKVLKMVGLALTVQEDLIWETCRVSKDEND